MFSADVTQQSPTEVIKVLVVALGGSDMEPSRLTLFFYIFYFFCLVCTLWINSFITNNDHL